MRAEKSRASWSLFATEVAILREERSDKKLNLSLVNDVNWL